MENKVQLPFAGEAQEKKMIKRVFAALILFLAAVTSLLAGAQQFKGHYLNNVDANGIILDGYDPVAFFTDHKPVKGNPQYRAEYEEATYFFASPEHRELFNSNPEKYKPQFGAWCAYAVSLGRTAPIDVNTFSIIEGRLVIQHNQRAVNGWNKNPSRNLQLADKYWPRVTANGGKQIKTSESRGWVTIALAVAGVVLLLAAIGWTARKRVRKQKDTAMKDITSISTI